MDGPVVGIVGCGYVVTRHFGDLPVHGTPTTYVDAVVAAGGRPVLLPGDLAAGLLDLVDALVLTGGGDLDPALYGGPSVPALGVDRARDDAELALLDAAEACGLPVLAVCRGMQLLAVRAGGSLLPDLGMAHVLMEGRTHPLGTRAGSLVGSLLGSRPHVSSLHHQAVGEAGGLLATAWADDGVVEAIEVPGHWPVLGVQWHPEMPCDPTGPALFGWLVEEAGTIRSGGRTRPILEPL